MIMGRLRQGNIAVGNFFFRHRNALFPVLFVCAALVGRPRLMFGDPGLDRLLGICGIVVALTGQAVRLITIGYEYIERGGKEGKVYASRLVQGGVYALTRNPMYVGNGLIAIGMTMLAGSPLIYLVVLPFFLFVYQALVAAEEAYLRKQFGLEYDRYCARVSRWWPRWPRIGPALSGLSYDWRQAIRKELSTMAGLFTGIVLLPLLRTYFLEGLEAARAQAPRAGMLELSGLAVYGLLVYLKRKRRLFYAPPNPPSAC